MFTTPRGTYSQWFQTKKHGNIAAVTTLRAMTPGRTVLSCLLCLLLIGGHWGFLQVIAWTGMVIDYSHHMSVPTAVVKALDGNDPCALCKTIIAATSNDQSDSAIPFQSLIKIAKADAVIAPHYLTVITPVIPLHFPNAPAISPHSFRGEPPQRPPISLS
jgi:hypothetical protein